MGHRQILTHLIEVVEGGILDFECSDGNIVPARGWWPKEDDKWTVHTMPRYQCISSGHSCRQVDE